MADISDDRVARVVSHSVEYHARGWEWALEKKIVSDNKTRIMCEIECAIENLLDLKHYIQENK